MMRPFYTPGSITGLELCLWLAAVCVAGAAVLWLTASAGSTSEDVAAAERAPAPSVGLAQAISTSRVQSATEPAAGEEGGPRAVLQERVILLADSPGGPVSTLETTEPEQLATNPLAFREPDPALGLNPTQLDGLNALRWQFAQAVGGPDQNPNDPAYLDRWKAAQQEYDTRLQGLLGLDVFSSLERDEARDQAAGAAR